VLTSQWASARNGTQREHTWTLLVLNELLDKLCKQALGVVVVVVVGIVDAAGAAHGPHFGSRSSNG
jgi:hypothetical protein